MTPAGTSNELYTHTHTHARVLYKHRIHGKLGLQLSFRWVFKEKSKHVYLVPGYGGKTNVKTFRWDERVGSKVAKILKKSFSRVVCTIVVSFLYGEYCMYIY